MVMQKVKPRNPKLIREFRKEYDCAKDVAVILVWKLHTSSKGAGGPASMSKGCHGVDHHGEMPKKELYRIAGKREKLTAEECRRKTRRTMEYDV
jgi:hypothetical protein